MKNLNSKKVTSLDKIPPKLVLLSANIIDSHLAKIINHDLNYNSFSKVLKIVTVCHIYKRNDRDKIENYRPVSILHCFSKVYEKFKFTNNLNHLWKLLPNVLLQLVE